MAEVGELLIIAKHGNEAAVREAAGMNAVELCAAEGRYVTLIEMSENNELPKKVREAAKNKIEVAEMKAVERYTAEGRYTDLIEMSKDKDLPKKVREAAGMKAIEGYTAEGDYNALIKMSKNNKLPKKVREAAKNKLQKITEQLAEIYGLKLTNPLQKDGLTVDPTRELLNRKEEPKKQPNETRLKKTQ